MELIVALVIVTWAIKYGVTDAVAAIKGETPARWERASRREKNKAELARARGEKAPWSQRGSGRRYAALLYNDAMDDLAERHVAKREKRKADELDPDLAVEAGSETRDGWPERIAARIGKAVNRRRQRRAAAADPVDEAFEDVPRETVEADAVALTPADEGDFRTDSAAVFSPDDVRRYAEWVKAGLDPEDPAQDHIDQWSAETQKEARRGKTPSEFDQLRGDLADWLGDYDRRNPTEAAAAAAQDSMFDETDDRTNLEHGDIEEARETVEAQRDYESSDAHAFTMMWTRGEDEGADAALAWADQHHDPATAARLKTEWLEQVDRARIDMYATRLKNQQSATAPNTEPVQPGQPRLWLVPDPTTQPETDSNSKETEMDNNTAVEATNLPAARAFATAMADSATQTQTQVEMNAAYLQNGGVSGAPVELSARLHEALGTVATLSQELDSELAKQEAIREQYMANTDAGDKAFQTGG